ncbi:MAG: hypothetical protein ACYS0I_04315 [Planctomycetota bacterium]|jgi:hypothetical protein
MKPSKYDKDLDELITRTVGRQKPTFDFDKWKQEHRKEIQMFKSQPGQIPHSVQPFKIWRIIMKNRITKFAAAAVIIIAAGVFLYTGNNLVPAVYALQDTIEAYNSIRWVHIVESATFSFGELRSSDIWLGCDEQGNVTRLRYQSDNVGQAVGALTIAGSFDSSETWLANHNLHLVGYGNPSVLLDYDVYELDPKYLFENLFDQESRGEAIVDVNEPKDKAEPIIVTVTYPYGSKSLKWKKVIYINKATKLVTKVEKYELRGKEFVLLKSLEFFDYNQPIDEMMFTLDGDVSSDAKVVDMTDVEAGLLQGDMTDEEVANELTKQFLEAAIAKDFYRAGQLYLAAPGFLVEQAFMGANVVKIISMGIAHRDPDPDSNKMNTSCRFLTELGGQYYEVNAFNISVAKVDKETNCWVMTGISIAVHPASGKVIISTDGADPSAVTYDGLVPGEFMKKWLVLGPLPYPVQDGIYFASEEGQKVAFDTEIIDFVNFTPNVTVENNDYQWAVLEAEYNAIDLTQLHETENVFNIAYLLAQIEMPEDREAVLGVGSDDAVKVWLNGELVHENWVIRGVGIDNDRVTVNFREGTNQLVLKIQNTGGPWGFCCRMLDE